MTTTTATRTVTVHPIKGRPIQLVLGSNVTPAQLARLSQRQRDTYTQVTTAATTRHPYLMSEAVDLVGCYVTAGARVATAKRAYLELNPNTPHTVASINAALGQLRALDPNFPGDTRWVAKTVIIQAALETAPDYFDPTGDLTDAYHLAGF
jgi:hypothetical protein